MDTNNERNEMFIEVTMRDKDGVLAIPASMTYSTQCLATGTAIKSNISITPVASIVNIRLDATDSAIINTANATEVKLLTVRAFYGTGSESSSEYYWRVINLRGV